jgi:hypothetical protein
VVLPEAQLFHKHRWGLLRQLPFYKEELMKVGDIIEGRRVTRVYNLCGCIAIDTEPVETKAEPEEIKETPKRRTRKKKE